MTQPYTRALGLALTLAGALLPSVSRATSVDVQAGWDLFKTASARFFFPPPLGGDSGLGWQTFNSNPITSYDFGPGVGVKDLVNTDTIVQRNAATFGTATGIVMKALSLISDKPIAGDLGGTAGDYVKTQLIYSYPFPTSEITINGMVNSGGTAGGTFSSVLKFDFALLDAVTNQVLVPTFTKTFKANGIWSSSPASPFIMPLIDGVNLTSDPGFDFFTVGPTFHDDGTGTAYHTTTQAPIPAALWLFGSALAGLGLFGKRRSSHAHA